MLSNQDIQNNWNTIKSSVLTKWSKLSETEVEKTHGEIQSLGELVQSKYGNIENFDMAYEKICKSSMNLSSPDFENRSKTAPAAEAGMSDPNSSSTDETLQAGSQEININNKDSNTHFSAPDEFTPSQDPSPSREDITLGRNASSATKISTAKAAPSSSEATSVNKRI